MSNIKDGEILYRYANPLVFPPGQNELPSCIFNDIEMSCDWEKLQPKPEFSPHVFSGRNMIVSITICDGIRNPANPRRTNEFVADWRQEIIHDPLAQKDNDAFTPNPSHALIKGKKKGAVTTVIRENSTFVVVEVPVIEKPFPTMMAFSAPAPPPFVSTIPLAVPLPPTVDGLDPK